MPRSRSRSIESRTCACISRMASDPVSSSSRSASVDFPWSICAIIAKLRMREASMRCFDSTGGARAARVPPGRETVGSTRLMDKVRSDDVDEFAGRDYLGLLPELWKMPLVAGYQIVDAGRFRAFQELVVVGIFRNLERALGVNDLSVVLYKLKQL